MPAIEDHARALDRVHLVKLGDVARPFSIRAISAWTVGSIIGPTRGGGMHSPREAALGLHQTADGFHAENFRPGACVLIQRNGERFWCVVEETAATKGIVNARVDQILLRNPSLMPGSLISFPKVDVLDLLTVDDFTKWLRLVSTSPCAALKWWEERKMRGGKVAGVV